jgi:hypothetical protein
MKRIVKFFSLMISILTLGAYGGQKNKGARRFGIPGIAFLVSLSSKLKWRSLIFLLLIPILVMGYGENSALMGFLGIEWLVRLAYALLLSLPFWLFGPRRGAFAAVSLALAFQLRAGSLGHISWFGDILIEDIARYGVLGFLVAFNIFRESESGDR